MISVFLTGVLLLGAGWYVLYGKGWMKNLHCKLWFAQEYVYAGGQAQIIEQIENHKRMPVPVLEIAFRIDKGVVFTQMENAMVSDYLYKRDVFFSAGQSADQKGNHFKMSGTGLLSGGPCGASQFFCVL